MIDRRTFLAGASALALHPLLAAEEERRMLARTIPAGNEAMPVIGFGNSSAFRDNDYETSSALLDVLRETGGRFIDIHGDSEIPVGRYMKQHEVHAQFFIGTNVGAAKGMPPDARLLASQDRQGKKPLDLLLLSRPADPQRQWPQMRRWKEQGLARYIGLAATGDAFFAPFENLIRGGTVDFIEINYSLLEPAAGERLLPLAMDHGVAVVVNRPFVNGRYFPLVSGKALPAWAADFDCASWAQFSLKYIIANPAVTCVITETSKPHHARDNLGAGFGRVPDDDQRARMLNLVNSL
ncbi:MAG: aldo/keto reductase [Gammaproteobacteria bacterium]|nr:aldo/keto reductase [Gammaproteobacteria bacterium]